MVSLVTSDVTVTTGAVRSVSQVSDASLSNGLPVVPWIPDPVAVSVTTYVPAGPVGPSSPSSVHVAPLSMVVSVWSGPASGTGVPPRVNERSSRPKPVTTSLKTMPISPTALLRGSGETSRISAVTGVGAM